MDVGTGDIYEVKYHFEKFIKIDTQHTSLVLGVSGELYELYRGVRLEKEGEIIRNGLSEGGEEYPLAYSSFGGHRHHAALRATHEGGALSTDLMFQEVEVEHLDENRRETKIILKDRYFPFWVTLCYLSYEKEDVIEQWIEIRHEEKETVRLHEYPSAEITFFNEANDFYLTSFYGLWERECEMQEERLSMGEKVLETRYGTWSSFDYNPSFILSIGGPAEEDFGDVLMGALAWSGAWKMSFEQGFGKLAHDRNERRHLSVRAGVTPYAGEYRLRAGEIFKTPSVVLTCSNRGKGRASRNMHSWARKYGLRQGDALRPILLNSWEGAYFNFDEKTLLAMMDGLADMGGEMFVLDDGWFGKGEFARNNADAGLGDWQVNREKLPGGLTGLANAAEERGLKFGIWVEPEMVNVKSELYRSHPDWIIRQEGREMLLYRNQLVLDLANPEVCEFVYQSVATLLADHPKIAYVKWDCNRSFINMGSSYLSSENQTHLWKDYVDGLYGIYKRLKKNFPQVMLQVCASGGGRIDYRALKYHHEFWASDNTDALQRIFIQWGIGHIYPAIACASHVSMCPNHQTGRTLPLKFRFDVAMSARMGLELKPSDMSEEELAFVRSAIDDYKKIRPIVQWGDLYRLASPYDGDVAALMYVYEGTAVVFVYKIYHRLGRVMPSVKLNGLEPETTYRCRELNRMGEAEHSGLDSGEYSGAFLMNKGIKMRLPKEYDSAVFFLEAQK